MKRKKKKEIINYLVTAHGVKERTNFYNYLHKLGYNAVFPLTREHMIESSYPFGVCFETKEIMIIESATMCYLNQKAGRLKTVEEFKEILNSMSTDN